MVAVRGDQLVVAIVGQACFVGQLTGDSGDDHYDPKLSPLQAFTNSSKLTANQSVDHLEAFVESMATLGGMALGGLGGAVGAKFVGALGETGNKYDFHMDDGHALKIIEKSGYQALPWVRYITQNGDYHLRMS